MKNEFDSDMLRIQNECAIVVLYCIGSRDMGTHILFSRKNDVLRKFLTPNSRYFSSPKNESYNFYKFFR